MKMTGNSIVIVALAWMTWGCSNEGGNRPTSGDPTRRIDDSPHPNTIKFYVDRGTGPVLQQARPLGEGATSPPSESASLEAAPIEANSTHGGGEPLGRIRQAATAGKGLDEVDTVQNDDSHQYVPGTTLLKYALLSCWDNRPDLERSTLSIGREIDAPWEVSYSSEDWYAIHYWAPIYTSTLGVPLFATCDHQLYAQEALLCAAEGLGESKPIASA